ncbi:MAG: hypothetical protein CSA21_01475 [Deltaproteobacteria bacterium]|nr:MAG: hypothetical protein CSA21_01475 [Deltaproteobacteria bacterium]
MEAADQAYPQLVNAVLPFWLRGFFAAVLFGAILSSFNSALNSSVTLFGVDIYRQYFANDATDQQVVLAGKKFGIVLAIASMTIAPFIANAPQGLFGYLQEVNGCYSIPILTIILVGIFSRKASPIAAKIALASGVGFYILSQFVLKPILGADSYPHFLHVMFILFVLNVCVMLFIGMLWPMDRALIKEPSSSPVDMTPYAAAKIQGSIIIAIVVGTFWFFT